MDDILDDNLVFTKGYTYRFKLWPVLVYGGMVAIGILFRLMHWPFASILIVTCSAALTAYAINGLTTLKGKDTFNLVMSILGILWFVIMIMGMLLNDGHPYNEKGVFIYLISFLVVFVSCAVLKRIRFRMGEKQSRQG